MATNKTLTPTNVTIQIPDFTDRPDQRVTNNCIDKEADAINALNSNVTSLLPLVIHGLWKSGQNLTIPAGGTYSTIIFVGYMQGHGNISLLIVKNGNTVTTYGLSGSQWTSGYHSFSASGNNITISSTAGGKSEGTFLIGAWT